MPWSHAFDCMSSHSCQLGLQLQDGAVCTLAVCVHKGGQQWQVVLQPSFVLQNKTAAAVHVHYTGRLLMPKARQAGNAEEQREVSQVASKAGCSFVLEPESEVGAVV